MRGLVIGGTPRRHWRTFLLLTLLASVALPAATTAAAPGDRLWSGLVSADAGKVVSPDWHEAIAVARSGDVYVAGSQATAASEDEDFLVARYGADGTLKWTRTYDHGRSEVITDVAVDRGGNVVLCGRENGYDGFLVVKMSHSGALMWARRLVNKAGLDGAEEIAIDGFGSIYVVGTAHSDLCLVKYSADGRRLWVRTYAKAEISSEIARGPDGKIYVGGNVPTATAGSQVCIARYSPAGQREWLRTIGTRQGVDDWIMDMDVRRSGICATGQSSLDGSTDGFVARLRLNGSTKYWHRIDGTDGAPGGSFEGCGMDALGRVSVAGWSGNDFAVRRYGSSGVPLNASAWHGTGSNAMAWAVVVTDMGSVYAAGRVTNIRTGQDMLTVGFDPGWGELFAVPYRSAIEGVDEATAIALGSGCVYVAGCSGGGLALIKYER